MPTVHEYDDARLARERQARLLLCRCRRPLFERIKMFDAMQCARCGRKLVPLS